MISSASMRMSVPVPASVAVSVPAAKHEQPDDVDNQADHADDHHVGRVRDLLGLEEALQIKSIADQV